jgi:type II secretory pathway component PulF
MGFYQFKARERAGAVRAGVLQAEDEAEVLKMLEEQGLLPIRIVEKKA